MNLNEKFSLCPSGLVKIFPALAPLFPDDLSTNSFQVSCSHSILGMSTSDSLTMKYVALVPRLQISPYSLFQTFQFYCLFFNLSNGLGFCNTCISGRLISTFIFLTLEIES